MKDTNRNTISNIMIVLTCILSLYCCFKIVYTTLCFKRETNIEGSADYWWYVKSLGLSDKHVGYQLLTIITLALNTLPFFQYFRRWKDSMKARYLLLLPIYDFKAKWLRWIHIPASIVSIILIPIMIYIIMYNYDTALGPSLFLAGDELYYGFHEDYSMDVLQLEWMILSILWLGFYELLYLIRKYKKYGVRK